MEDGLIQIDNIMMDNDDDAYWERIPPGFRFKPEDDELIEHYLQKKIDNQPLPPNKINAVNLYQYNPQTLAKNSKPSGENEWYFFTPRDKKYKNGQRPKRSAGDGYWKATGADKPILREGVKVGCKRALVFYVGKAPGGEKTNWIMHEYLVNDPPISQRGEDDMRLDDWVLCRIYKKPVKSIAVVNGGMKDEVVQTQEPNMPAGMVPEKSGFYGNGPCGNYPIREDLHSKFPQVPHHGNGPYGNYPIHEVLHNKFTQIPHQAMIQAGLGYGQYNIVASHHSMEHYNMRMEVMNQQYALSNYMPFLEQQEQASDVLSESDMEFLQNMVVEDDDFTKLPPDPHIGRS